MVFRVVVAALAEPDTLTLLGEECALLDDCVSICSYDAERGEVEMQLELDAPDAARAVLVGLMVLAGVEAPLVALRVNVQPEG